MYPFCTVVKLFFIAWLPLRGISPYFSKKEFSIILILVISKSVAKENCLFLNNLFLCTDDNSKEPLIFRPSANKLSHLSIILIFFDLCVQNSLESDYEYSHCLLKMFDKTRNRKKIFLLPKSHVFVLDMIIL